MRVLYLSADPGVPILGHKGASVHTRAVVSAFAALGAEVVVASPRIEPGENALPAGIPLVEIPPVRPRDHADPVDVERRAEEQATRVIELARELGSEAVYERFSLASFAGARAAHALAVPLVLEVNAPLRAEEVRFRELRHPELALAAEREVLSAATRVLAVSRPLAEWLVREGVERERVEVVPNAFPDALIARARPAGAGEQLVVGFAGGLKLWHGVDVMIRAARMAVERGAQIRLEVAGTGPAERHLEDAWLPADAFARLGHLPHEVALAQLGRWDVGLAPFTAVEDFWFSPLKVLEYMAAGLAVVASDLGDIPALLDDAGVLVPAGDAGSLAAVLVELDADRERVASLGARAAAIAAGGPTWTDNARHALDLFASARVPA